ncbi:phosphotransferase family protein [Hyphomonas sp.]|uniref:phosphotransferase family protein n=1 Tax=Hyphomonas sp. TaxID=87 RepID=UPI0032ED3775
MEWQKYINLNAVKDWMDQQGLGRGAIESPHLLTGGTQNFLLHFKRDCREYVLRRPPAHLRKNSNSTMLRESRILAALAGSDVPHPGLIASCADENVIGACFYLMEPVDGFNPTGKLSAYHQAPEVQRRMGFALVDAIAALGAIDYKSVGLEDFGRPDGFIDRQVPRWRGQLESYCEHENWPGPSSLPGVEELTLWLERNKPSDLQPGIFHGDFHFGNVMYRHDSPELAAIVDWELSSIGDPLIDLGWLMSGWPLDDGETFDAVSPWNGFPTLDEMIARYGERSGRNLDHLTWYGVLACFKLGTILEGTFARACAGKAPKETGEQLHGYSLRLFKRGLSFIARA